MLAHGMAWQGLVRGTMLAVVLDIAIDICSCPRCGRYGHEDAADGMANGRFLIHVSISWTSCQAAMQLSFVLYAGLLMELVEEVVVLVLRHCVIVMYVCVHIYAQGPYPSRARCLRSGYAVFDCSGGNGVPWRFMG